MSGEATETEVTRDDKGRVTKGSGAINPGGRPKEYPEFRKRARVAVDAHVVDKWTAEVVNQGESWVECSKLLAAYGYGRPSEHVEVSGDREVTVFAGMTLDELKALARLQLEKERKP